MSHQPERKEKNCLNCGTAVIGRYCHVCGQENIEPKESVWHLASHFFNDITHFDGKFFTTLKDVTLKPGFLSREYVLGRRASYLNPVRMYIFTSALFFLLFFSFLRSQTDTIATTTVNGKSLEQIEKMDSATFAKFTANINKEDDKPAVPMTRQEFQNYIDSSISIKSAGYSSRGYSSKKEYDSLRKKGKVKDSWFKRQFISRELEIREKYKSNAEISAAFTEKLLHSLPQMLFISLPLFALILQLLYIRRKQFYYVSHFIFSIHLYVFLFIDIFFVALVSRINAFAEWRPLRYIEMLFLLAMLVYTYLALKNFYRQGAVKTVIKFIILLLFFFVLLILLFSIFVLLSFFKI